LAIRISFNPIYSCTMLPAGGIAQHNKVRPSIEPGIGWGRALSMKRQLAEKMGQAPDGLLRPMFGSIPIIFRNS
jgi:hypothetical protein